MTSASRLPAVETAILTVAAKSYLYRLVLAIGFGVLLCYNLALQGGRTGLFILSLLQIIFCADILLRNAYKDVRQGHMTLSVLAAVSVCACFAYNISKTFFVKPLAGVLPDLYLLLAGIIVSYLLLACLAVRHQEYSQVFLKKLDDYLPKSARVVRGNKDQIRFAQEVGVGELVRVYAGEMIPCDGILVKGDSYIEESFITGNMLPARKTSGSWVYAGTLNQGAEITVRVEKTLQASILTGILETIKHSETRRCLRMLALDRYAGWLLAGGISAAVLSYIWVYGKGGDARLFCSVGAFLLALGISCPVSFFFAAAFPAYFLKRCARRHQIDIYGLQALAKMKEAEVVFVDKTGTLTYGQLMVQSVHPAAQVREEELLAALLSAEQKIEDPFAAAVQTYAQKQAIKPLELTSVQVYPGLGVQAVCKGQTILAGRASWLQEQGVKMTAPVQAEQPVICVARDGKYMGYVLLEDRLRPGAAELVASLQEQGKEVVLMSGDTQASVQAVARQTGIEKVNFGVLPQTKAEIINNYRALGKTTVMLGDGFNDIIALLQADAGIIFCSGKNVYNNCVDLKIDRPDLYSVMEVFGYPGRLASGVRGNVLLSWFCNVLLLVALLGVPSAWWQRWFFFPLLVLGTVLILFLYSMRLLRYNEHRKY